MQELRIPAEEFKERIDKVKIYLDKEGLNALLLLGDEHNYANVRYFSDYRPMLEYAMVIIPLKGEPILLAGPECADYAYMVSKIERINICSDLAIPGEEYPHTKMISLQEIIKELDSKRKLNKIGIANLNFQPAFLVDTIKKTLTGREIIDASQFMNELRAIKSENEIAIMEKTYEITNIGLKKGLETLTIGKKETEVAAEMAYPMWKEGPEQMSHCFIIASGKRSAPALNFPTDKKKINNGDLVILDIGVVYEGYFSDAAITTIVGEKRKEIVHILNIAKEAQNAAIDKMKPGVRGWEVDKAARDIIKELVLVKIVSME